MLYKWYESRRPEHDPTDSYFYLARRITKCMMRADSLNLHVYLVRTEITGTKHIPILHVCSMDESESEELLVKKIIVGMFYGRGRIKKYHRQ